MSDPVHTEHAPPKSWEQFEELCADVFEAEWKDQALVRHGRGGQAQDGVDIYGREGKKWPVGLQCKKKTRWPVKRLTSSEVDKEVAAARKFLPKLKSFYILTTAPDDVALQEHVRLITKRHKRQGLFDVNVLGWAEICRRATRHPSIARKHFGLGSGPPAPLLTTWYASGGRLELKGRSLAIACRELAHDLRDCPTGRVLLRQRESAKLVAELALFEGRKLSPAKRESRLALRDKLARQESDEAWISRGLKLLLGDPTIASWVLKVHQDSGDAARAVTGFVNHELHPQKAVVMQDTIRLRVSAPKHPDIRQSHYISRAQVSSILALMQSRAARYGPSGHFDTVSELPDPVRGQEAIPAVMRAILRHLDEGHAIEDLRKVGILDIGLWDTELG